MRKIFFIIPILFAYAIILGHNLIPHTHHAHKQEAKHDHHHSDHAQHDHDNHTNESENEEGSLPDLFGHFVHSPFTVTIEHTLVLAEAGKEIKNIHPDTFVVEESFAFDIVITERKLPPDVRHQFYSNYSARHSSLRAPPVC